MASRSGRRGKLIAVGIGILPILLLEITLRAFGYGQDPFSEAGPVGAVLVASGPRMVVAPERRRQLRTEPFLATKPAGTIRIIVVGDSGTFGFRPAKREPGAGEPKVVPAPYPVLLGQRLSRRTGGDRFEVINCGVCGFGTPRLLQVVREVVGYSPDVVVFLAGSSDFLESRLFENWQAMRESGLGALRQVRSLTLARNLLWPRRARRTSAREGFDFRSPWLPVLDTDVIRGPHEVRALEERAAANLEGIVAACREAGVALVLCTVPSNLRIPPQAFFSYEPEVERRLLGHLPREEVVEFNQALLAALRLVEDGENARALEHLARAIPRFGDDPRGCGLHFLAAQAHSRLGDFGRAWHEYVVARDLDVFVWRATSRFNNTVRRLAGEEGVHLADVERAFGQAVPDGIPDGRLFFDHNHPNPQGHAVAAEEIERVLEASGLLGGER